MSNPDIDKVFAGAIPKLYNTYLVPMIFEPYAEDMVGRLALRPLQKILEVAAGTGVLTRAMASNLPDSVSIVATDLNQGMIDQAMEIGTARQLEWRQADAMQLPFEDETFDAVVCQFGAMFFPDKAKAFAEARRVLKPGGIFIFSVWDRMAENDFAAVINSAIDTLFPEDPPRFMERTPYGYYDFRVIERDLVNGGFTSPPQIETVTARSRADHPQIPAVAYCQGTPLRNEIEARDASRLSEATDVAANSIRMRFGPDLVDGKIQAHIVTVER